MGYAGTEFSALKAIQHRELTKAVEHLLGICTGMVADGQVQEAEIRFLHLWLQQHQDVTAAWPGKVIAQRVDRILSDGVITTEERQHLFDTLSGICGFQLPDTGAADAGVAAIPFDDDPSIWFDGRTFCFTGNFLFGTRANCERAIMQRGSVALSNVTTKLEYLVVGSLIEPSWSNTTYGRKIEKAMRYIDKGHGIAIVSERQWTAALEAAPTA